MPRIQKTALSPEFSALISESNAHNEKDDCSVKAVALITGRPYAEVHAVFAACGRKTRRGTPLTVSLDALEELGVKVRIWTFNEMRAMMDSYPGADTTNPNRSITTHHWRRFPRSWAPHRHKKFILVTRNHMLAVVDGEVKDWSINRSLHVIQIWEVVE